MRVIRGMGCVSGRVASICYSFGPGATGDILDRDGLGRSDEDTRLPSERLGANRPLIAINPVFPKPKRLTAGTLA
jgi:hypothetical protein